MPLAIIFFSKIKLRQKPFSKEWTSLWYSISWNEWANVNQNLSRYLKHYQYIQVNQTYLTIYFPFAVNNFASLYVFFLLFIILIMISFYYLQIEFSKTSNLFDQTFKVLLLYLFFRFVLMKSKVKSYSCCTALRPRIGYLFLVLVC